MTDKKENIRNELMEKLNSLTGPEIIELAQLLHKRFPDRFSYDPETGEHHVIARTPPLRGGMLLGSGENNKP